MAKKVIWSYAAEEDLDAAADYIHKDSPAYAAAFVDRVLEAARSLNEFAKRGISSLNSEMIVSEKFSFIATVLYITFKMIKFRSWP